MSIWSKIGLDIILICALKSLFQNRHDANPQLFMRLLKRWYYITAINGVTHNKLCNNIFLATVIKLEVVIFLIYCKSEIKLLPLIVFNPVVFNSLDLIFYACIWCS